MGGIAWEASRGLFGKGSAVGAVIIGLVAAAGAAAIFQLAQRRGKVTAADLDRVSDSDARGVTPAPAAP